MQSRCALSKWAILLKQILASGGEKMHRILWTGLLALGKLRRILLCLQLELLL